MSLKTGAWKMNENGREDTLTIGGVDPTSGQVTGSLGIAGDFTGIWDETSRTLTFVPVGVIGMPIGMAPPPQPVYKALLFSTPRNPVPGQDVVWTLAGFVQITDLGTATVMGGNARRNVFGWFAQIMEVA